MKRLFLIALAGLFLIPLLGEVVEAKESKKTKKYYAYKSKKYKKYRKKPRIRRYPYKANVNKQAERLKLEEMVRDLF
ncbi:MAG: hypothetical protein GXN96_03685 [Aquificae bacterium]|nr:hypothetical protein [Aquificota bacterium]